MTEAVSEFPARVYHASDLYTLPAQASRARRVHAKLIYDARELYPHVASTSGRPWIRWFWQAVERRFIRRADFVSTVSPSIAQHMASAYRIAPPVVLYNVPEYTEVAPSNRIREALAVPEEVPIILHQGNVQKHRGCFILAEAMQEVDNALLVFMGGGPLNKALQDHVHALGISDRVRFLPRVDPSVLLAYTASADVGVSLLEDTCLNHRYALPNKLFEYFMAGVPVLASDLPEIRRVVTQFNTGVLVDPSDKKEIARKLRSLLEEPGLLASLGANTRAVFETFNWEQASQEFVTRYISLLSP